MTERQRWLALVLTLVVGLGGAVGAGALYTYRVERDAQRDMCDMINAVVPPGAPPPASERERQRTEAINRYRERRC